jgi:hypothetical protein
MMKILRPALRHDVDLILKILFSSQSCSDFFFYIDEIGWIGHVRFFQLFFVNFVSRYAWQVHEMNL